MRKLRFAIAAAFVAAAISVLAAYAADMFPPQTPGPATSGFFVSNNRISEMRLQELAQAVNPDGSRLFVQHSFFAPNQSTGWHTHPGPAIVMIVSGSQTLIEPRGSHCLTTTAEAGEGFVSDTGIHQAVTGPSGAESWAIYVLPVDAQTVRAPVTGSLTAPSACQ
jgi:hypothetical protein